MKIWGMREGEIVFPKMPLLRIEGPLIVGQLMETTLLNLLNYPCLIATNAARYRNAADLGAWNPKQKPKLLEFGTRRAQGPDGALSASRYSYLGGFDGTSNVKAGHVFHVPINGTHAHAFVASFAALSDVPEEWHKFRDRCLEIRKNLGYTSCHDGEMAAFVCYAMSYPDSMLALVDTYDTIVSGTRNFLSVAIALLEMGHRPLGIRLDSGDLAYLSKECRKLFAEAAKACDFLTEDQKEQLRNCRIAASNDINERILQSLAEQGHSIDIYGIGTNLVTCQAQPALGMVYKLVELNGEPRMKLSDELGKVSIPSKKMVYRLYGKTGEPLTSRRVNQCWVKF